jgi:hypothetical protein
MNNVKERMISRKGVDLKERGRPQGKAMTSRKGDDLKEKQ